MDRASQEEPSSEVTETQGGLDSPDRGEGLPTPVVRDPIPMGFGVNPQWTIDQSPVPTTNGPRSAPAPKMKKKLSLAARPRKTTLSTKTTIPTGNGQTMTMIPESRARNPWTLARNPEKTAILLSKTSTPTSMASDVLSQLFPSPPRSSLLLVLSPDRSPPASPRRFPSRPAETSSRPDNYPSIQLLDSDSDEDFPPLQYRCPSQSLPPADRLLPPLPLEQSLVHSNLTNPALSRALPSSNSDNPPQLLTVPCPSSNACVGRVQAAKTVRRRPAKGRSTRQNRSTLPSTSSPTTSPASAIPAVSDASAVPLSSSSHCLRINAKGFFLTYPRCTAPKHQLLDHLKALHPNNPLVWCRVAQEAHQSGDQHLHAALLFSKKLNLTNPRHFDLPGGHHGNYQQLKAPAEAVEYLSKEDPCPLDFGVVPKKKPPPVGKMELIARQLQKGATPEEIDQEFPGVYLANKRKIEEYYGYQRLLRRRRERVPWVPLRYKKDYIECAGVGVQLHAILGWLNSNIPATNRPIKTPQLYIWGPGNIGKTSLIDFIERRYSVYKAPATEDFFDGYDDDAYDMVVFDEFAPGHNVTYLRQFLDGQSMVVRKKCSQIDKRRNIPVILLSNRPIDEHYSDKAVQDLFHVRLLEVSVQDRLPIEDLEWVEDSAVSPIVID